MSVLRAVMVLVALAGSAGAVLADPPDRGGDSPMVLLRGSSFVVAPMFDGMLKEFLRSSETMRSQYYRITSAPRLRVRIGLMLSKPVDRSAQTEFSRSPSGELEARVSIATPLRSMEYAEMLAHEFEHILEQIEGQDLGPGGSGGGIRLADGAFETERARRAGREAAAEVEGAR